MACERLSAIAAASGTDWARGVAAIARAVGRRCPTTSTAKPSSGWAPAAAYLARARLCYGEWLRRTKRRAEARTQLRRAFDAFATMGANAFAERARRGLQPTGENVRRQRVNDGAELTPQEQQIAQLASARRTNPEIGAELFLSARTVEWHLRNIYTKLNITSRRELDAALARRSRIPLAQK